MSLIFSKPFLHSQTPFITSPLPLPSRQITPKSLPLSLHIAAGGGAAASPPAAAPTNPPSFRAAPPNQVNILVVGSTGYIGKSVVKELCGRGFNVIAVARGPNSQNYASRELAGATICVSDVTDPDALRGALAGLGLPIHAAVSCLASRSGGVRDSWNVDYHATRNSLAAARRHGAAHFVLLSAVCVQKPLLEFQRAKLKFEAELAREAAGDPTFSYSIVRPTAFFKSLGGQVERVRDGKPYVMFGDGKLCSCKPISEGDLAAFIADCVVDEKMAGRVLPVGGPGKALTPLEQGEMLFRLLGREPKFLKVPIGVMDFAIGMLEFFAKIFPAADDAAEFGRIGRYYAVESMLVIDPATGEYSAEKTPSYGKDTLEEFFARVIREGMAGQELGTKNRKMIGIEKRHANIYRIKSDGAAIYIRTMKRTYMTTAIEEETLILHRRLVLIPQNMVHWSIILPLEKRKIALEIREEGFTLRESFEKWPRSANMASEPVKKMLECTRKQCFV